MATDDKPFGKRVRRAMKRRKITEAQLASAMEASPYTVRSWTLGRRRPRDLARLAECLGTSVGTLYGERAA